MNYKLAFAGLSALLIASLIVGVYYFTSNTPSRLCKSPTPNQSPTSNQTQSQYDEIIQDTTFYSKDSPYQLNQSVLVLPGATLSIEANVVVKFGFNTSLIINGSLNAIGTSDANIIFTSSNPSTVVWDSIKFFGNTSEFFVLKYAEVTNATYGVAIENSENGNVTIENCNIHHNKVAGIWFACKGNIVLKGNTISSNANGIIGYARNYASEASYPWLYLSSLDNVLFQSNTIQLNEIQGVQLQSSGKVQAKMNDISFISNIISKNGDDGIQIVAVCSMDSIVSNIDFQSNAITDNGKNGIQLISRSYSPGNVSILLYSTSLTSNVISGNGEAGVHIKAAGHQQTLTYDVTLMGNTISNNSLREGVLIEGAVTTNVTSNIITQNRFGISYNQTKNNLAAFNTISNNTQGMLVYSGATVQAQNNYWGDPTGPYHPELNPIGQGNRINGNGIDLKFAPLLQSEP